MLQILSLFTVRWHIKILLLRMRFITATYHKKLYQDVERNEKGIQQRQ